MGTRADFYVGRGKSAEWLGSIAWDGYPNGHPEPLLTLESEADFRAKVAEIIESEKGTTPDMGWPWPWKDSNTTDYAYAFDAGCVWGTRFGHGWWAADEEPEDNDAPKLADWPQMKTDRAAPAGSDRSGVIIIQVPRIKI